MTCVVVNDANCLIDLRKGSLLHALVRLPYQLMVPYAVWEDELLDFTEQERQLLLDGDILIYDLSPLQMEEVFSLKAAKPGLSAEDCMCFIAADHENGILLSGDKTLRSTAEKAGIEVHGILWVTDQLEANSCCSKTLLVKALTAWQEDRTVFLPDCEIDKRIRRLKPE